MTAIECQGQINLNPLVNGLIELAFEAKQKKYWLGHDDAHQSSFTEAISAVFDDSRIQNLRRTSQLHKYFSLEFIELLEKLDHSVSELPELEAPHKIINHQNMSRCREDAKRLLLFILEHCNYDHTVLK